jgi:hypothetical protein
MLSVRKICPTIKVSNNNEFLLRGGGAIEESVLCQSVILSDC